MATTNIIRGASVTLASIRNRSYTFTYLQSISNWNVGNWHSLTSVISQLIVTHIQSFHQVLYVLTCSPVFSASLNVYVAYLSGFRGEMSSATVGSAWSLGYISTHISNLPCENNAHSTITAADINEKLYTCLLVCCDRNMKLMCRMYRCWNFLSDCVDFRALTTFKKLFR